MAVRKILAIILALLMLVSLVSVLAIELESVETAVPELIIRIYEIPYYITEVTDVVENAD